MRYAHESVRRIRSVMLTRLGYIINARCRAGCTQTQLANEYGVSISAIRAIKNGEYSGISLDRLLMVADGAGMDYVIITSSKGGHKETTLSLQSYSSDPLIQRLVVEAEQLKVGVKRGKVLDCLH